jgi:hypothetical protein
MTARRLSAAIGLALMACLALPAPGIASQGELAQAKELYLSASYEEALTLLDRLQKESQGETAIEVALYRMLCLLVLERNTEATKVVEWIVNADPFYLPSDAQASPRIRTFFQDVRRELLPTIVRRAYADAKASFDKKDPAAGAKFARVLALLDDPDLKNVPELTDLRTVASGFRDLAAAAATPAAPPAPEADAALKPAEPAVKGPPPIAHDGDPGVVAPVALSQALPIWKPVGADSGMLFTGILEVLIDERGAVTSAIMRDSVHPQYDAQAIKVAMTWKYRPATRNGVPTRFLKVIGIRLQPTSQ